LARLDVATPIAIDAVVTVVLDFVTTAPNNGGTNFYGTLNHDGQTLALVTAYPHLAMLNNGVWDTAVPDSKGDLVTSPVAFYDVTTTLPRTHAVLSTGTAVSTTTTATTQTVRVVSGLQRDFALAATTLAQVNTTVDGTAVRVYYPTGKLKAGQVTLKYAQQALRFFNQSYGQYPYNEIDLIAVNAGTFEGIEFPGVVLFEQRRFNTSSDYESLVAHEVAHQWFYGVVGNDVQNHAWVDEGLATYSQVLYLEALRGAKVATSEKRLFVDDYAYLKSQKADGSMDRPIRTMSDDQYGVLSYSKAALYIDAIRTQIGTKTFTTAVKRYYATNRYAMVDGSAFVQAVNASCGCDVQPLYTSWVLAR
jgi:aminopeptidase N